ncbi:MAG: glycosyltransferase family 4 protein [Steroidobacteraceae bacterium]|nr:glycosyltransferase family 4 protein [Steroidobacteraceae bacterium]
MSTWLAATGAFLATIALTGLVRRYALHRGMLDVPNARSSHTVPTPRGGGVAIVAVALFAAAMSYAREESAALIAVAWFAGGGTIALVGYLDDRRGIAPALRFLVHLAAGVLVVVAVGGLPRIPWGDATVHLAATGWVIGVLAVVWSINLFNFMDGIDGLAAAQAAFVCVAGAALSLLGGAEVRLTMPLVVAGCALGFLFWNWAPARIFMGDAGSGFLGFALALVALDLARGGGPSLWVWLILHGTFVVDATVTLVTRLRDGDRVWEAHRKHAYQRLARAWRSHARVSATYAAVNVAWLLPWALVATLRPGSGAWVAAVALTPLVVSALWLGAGRTGDIR